MKALVRRTAKGPAATALWLFWALLAFAPIAHANPPLSQYQVKALFILNFTRYVAWPDDAFETEDEPFTIGIVGQDPFDDNLHRVIEGRTVNGRPITVKNVSTRMEIAACHILFLSSSEASRLDEILDETSGLPILVVGEDPRLLKRGGAIEFVPRDENIRFKINLDAARKANLQISSQLLQVADSVIVE